MLSCFCVVVVVFVLLFLCCCCCFCGSVVFCVVVIFCCLEFYFLKLSRHCLWRKSGQRGRDLRPTSGLCRQQKQARPHLVLFSMYFVFQHVFCSTCILVKTYDHWTCILCCCCIFSDRSVDCAGSSTGATTLGFVQHAASILVREKTVPVLEATFVSSSDL